MKSKTQTPALDSARPKHDYTNPASWFFIPVQYRDTWEEVAPTVDTSDWRTVARGMCINEVEQERAIQLSEHRTRELARGERSRPTLLHPRPFQEVVPSGGPVRRESVDMFSLAAAAGAPTPGTPLWAGTTGGFESTINARIERDAEGYRARAEHAIRARHVKQIADESQERAKRVAAAKLAVACPVCGDTTTGYPIRRHLVDSFDKPGYVEARIAQDGCDPVPELTSCAKCFEVAKAIYIEELRGEMLLPKMSTRETLVRAQVFSPSFVTGGE